MTPEEYLQSHGLNKAYVTKKLGWQIHADRITIPIYNRDNTLAYTRTRMLIGDKKFLNETGTHPSIPYCINKIQDEQDIVFAEGEPDTARLWQEGIPAITAPTGVQSGSKINPEYLALLAGKTIYLTLDTDPAGQSQVTAYAKILANAGATVHIVTLPPASKDICEYLTTHPVDDFYTLMNEAPSAKDLMLASFLKDYPIIPTSTFIETDYPKPKWLIESLIRMDGISLIVGESGTGKTIFSLTVANAIATATPWLDKYPTSQQRVLILDKENTPADIQKLCLSMNINTPNIFHLFAEDDYSLMDENGQPTPFADNIKLYATQNNITTVILDSVIDFLVGEENSSGDVARNINIWRSIFPTCTILGIHHEGKTPMSGKRSSSDRIRGSSVWKSAAQSILSLSVINPLEPDILLVEHTKVRGGKKCQPFEIKMQISPQGTETIVTGYSFIREVTDIQIVSEKLSDAIINFLAKEPKTLFTYDQIVSALQTEEFKSTKIKEIITDLCNMGDLKRVGAGKKNDPYKVCLSNANSYNEVESYISNEK